MTEAAIRDPEASSRTDPDDVTDSSQPSGAKSSPELAIRRIRKPSSPGPSATSKVARLRKDHPSVEETVA